MKAKNIAKTNKLTLIQKVRAVLFTYRVVLLMLTVITTVGLLIRFLYFPENIYFGYDQARDAFAALEIYQQGDIKLQGPSSSLEGIFHGPLTYYLLGLLYLFGGGNPTVTFLFFTLLNTLSIPVMYMLAYAVTKKVQVGLLAAALFAASFEQTQWAIFISNTSLASFGLLLLFTGCAFFWFEKRNIGVIIAAIGFLIAVQAEIFLFYTLVPLAVFGWLMRKRLQSLPGRYKAIMAVLLFLGTLTYATSELLFRFPFSHVLLKSLATVRTVDTASLTANVVVERYGVIAYHSIFGYNPFIALLLLVACLLALRRIFRGNEQHKLYFAYSWLFSSLLLLLFNVGFANIYHFSVGTSLMVILIVAVVLSIFVRNSFLLTVVLVVLFYGQFRLIERGNRNGAYLTAVQKDMLLSNEKAVVQHIAKRSKGTATGVTALTNPYNVNTVWAYIFSQYWPKDQPLPVWVTNFAKGYEGERVFTEQLATLPCTYYIIYEPPHAIPEYTVTLFLAHEDGRSDIIERHRFGAITLEERLAKVCQNASEPQLAHK